MWNCLTRKVEMTFRISLSDESKKWGSYCALFFVPRETYADMGENKLHTEKPCPVFLYFPIKIYIVFFFARL